MTKKCRNCGKEYSNKRRKYCSEKCMDAFNVAKYTKVDRTEKECLFCGKKFFSIKRKYCSSNCAAKNNYWKKYREDKLKKVYCKKCGEKLTHGRQEYCRNCYKEHVSEVRKKRRKERMQDPKYISYLRQRAIIEKHTRKAKIKSGGSFTEKDWKDLCGKYDNKCLCCGEEKKLSVDHVIPLSRGGSNTIDNIQPLCVLCNSKKGTKDTDYR